MPDRRSHRGPHSEDQEFFALSVLPALQDAAADYCWLLNRGYPAASSLALCGNRYRLKNRQRTAVSRWACDDEALRLRCSKSAKTDSLAGAELYLDGFNVLTTIEAALGGGVVLACRDEMFRDMASMHGTFRHVSESAPALKLLGKALEDLAASRCVWFFDAPVSNSGRLKANVQQLAADRNWPWIVELAPDADRALLNCGGIVASADSVVVDNCTRWFNLARHVVEQHIDDAWIVNLAG